jgi:hypothetical protein
MAWSSQSAVPNGIELTLHISKLAGSLRDGQAQMLTTRRTGDVRGTVSGKTM